jgi:predicted secreted protein
MTPKNVRLIMGMITKAMNNFVRETEKKAGLKVKRENRYFYDSKENKIKINKKR